MPDHTPEHLQRMAEMSAARRRAEKIASLLATAPRLEAGQVQRLHHLLEERIVSSGGNR